MADFQFNPEVVSNGRVGASAAAPALDNQGGNSSFGVIEASRWGEGSFSAGAQIPEFISALVKPKLDAQARAKMYQGFTDAREGKTLQEIQDEQPWYSRIFGQTNYELGATTFLAMKAGADIDKDFSDQMSELRKLDSATVGQRINDITEKGMTGDIFADSMLMKNVMERAGPMLDAHTKARVEWQQSELSLSENAAYLSGSSAYQTAMRARAQQGRSNPNEPLDPATQQETTRNFLSMFQAAPGRDGASFQKNLVVSIEQMADQGDWYSVNALRDSGIMSQLPPEVRDRLDSKLDTARSKFKQRLGESDLIKPLAMFNSSVTAGLYSPAQTVEHMQEINAQYEALTGDRDGYFQLDDYVRSATTSAEVAYRASEREADRLAARQEKAETEAAKEAVEAAKTARLANAAVTGTVGSMPGASDEDKDEAMMAAANTPRFADVLVRNFSNVIAGNEPFVSKRMKVKLQREVELSAGEQWTAGFNGVYEKWKALRYYALEDHKGVPDRTSGAAAALHYFGDYADNMQDYDDLIRGGETPQLAYRQAFGTEASQAGGKLSGAGLSTMDKAEFLRVIKDDAPSWYEFGKTSPGTSANNLVIASSAYYYAKLTRNNPTVSNKENARAAIQMAKSNGLEISGRYAWQNSRDQASVTLDKWAGMEKGVFDTHFDAALTERFKKKGIGMNSDTSVTILRLADDSNGPRLIAIAQQDGKRATLSITGADIKKVRDRTRTFQVQTHKNNPRPVTPSMRPGRE